jgi:signal transduction histidine kinase
MSTPLDSRKIKTQFENYLGRIFINNLAPILMVGAAFLSYYIFSDWSVRHNTQAVVIRVIPMIFIVILLIVHLVYRHQFYRFKKSIYILIYLTLQLMMYAKCLLHLHDEALAPSVTGAILIIFLISLDAKQLTKLTAFIYALPVIIFTLLLILIGKPSDGEFLVIADIYPILIIGFIINRVQYNLRFKLFKTNKLLLNEQNKTKALYSESRIINKELEHKAIEAKAIKEEIEEKNEELKKINVAKDKFLGIIAHDLKNPIGNICGLSDLLLNDNQLDEKERATFLELINDSILHTHRLLDNLLDWARAQGKTIAFVPSQHNAYELVEEELKALRPMAKKKKISVKNQIPRDFQVFIDQNMFETIIRNLVANAIKFTAMNGEVNVYAQLVQLENRDFAEILVADNGVGMEANRLSKLFKISENTSTMGTENEAGTGLGLLLSKEFVDLHKGKISVTSKPGEGSVFKCLFPLN